MKSACHTGTMKFGIVLLDQNKMKFVSVPVEGLRCPRSDVNTSDGGL
jgi:hypothetical protein